MNVSEAIRKRRSIRKYKENVEIPEEHIKMILEAAMMAPSACNTRPWEFVVIKSKEVREMIAEKHRYARHMKGASLGIVVCAKPEIQEGQISEGFYPQDCGAAVQNILLQSLELGYGTCWCGLYPVERTINKFKDILDIKSVPFALIVLGVPDEEPMQRGFYDETLVSYR